MFTRAELKAELRAHRQAKRGAVALVRRIQGLAASKGGRRLSPAEIAVGIVEHTGKRIRLRLRGIDLEDSGDA